MQSYSQMSLTTQISIGKHEVEEGKMISIPLTIKPAEQITALQFIISYDSSAINLSSIELAEGIQDKAIFQAMDQGGGKVAVLLIAAEGFLAEVSLLHLTFKALSSEANGSLLAIEEAAAFKDPSGEKSSVEVSHGYIVIANPSIPGLLYPVAFSLVLLGALVLTVIGVKLLSSKKKVRSLCPSCGTILQKGSAYCHICKQVFRKKCRNCGAIVPISNTKCPYCTQTLKEISYAHKPSISARLQFLTGMAKGKRYVLEGTIITIGRSRKNQLVLKDDLQVSGYHAQIVRQGGYFIILDLKSTNGTYVNQNKITQHILRDGDNISVGNTNFVFNQGE